MRTCQHHLAGHEDEQHNLGLLHAVDEAREQLRLVLQAHKRRWAMGSSNRNSQAIAE
jgi:hypothetical protein